MKKYLYLSLAILGFLMYVSLYFIVAYFNQDYIKYIVALIGFAGVIIFPIGFLKFMKEIRKNKKEENK